MEGYQYHASILTIYVFIKVHESRVGDSVVCVYKQLLNIESIRREIEDKISKYGRPNARQLFGRRWCS
jgi:hypothetical protein